MNSQSYFNGILNCLLTTIYINNITIVNSNITTTKPILSIMGSNSSENNSIIFRNWYLTNVTWTTVATYFAKKGVFNLVCETCFFFIDLFDLTNINLTKSKF